MGWLGEGGAGGGGAGGVGGGGFWEARAALLGWSRRLCSLQTFSEPGNVHLSV